MPDDGTALDKLRSGDLLTIDEIRGLTSSDIVELRVLALNGSPAVRRGALVALTKRAEPGCDNVYELCLRDPDPDIASLGIEGLQARLEAWHQGPLLEALDSVADVAVRRELARTLGMLDARLDFWELKKRLDAERDTEVRRALLLAAARVGDGPARQEVLRDFQASRDAAKREYFDRHLPYLKGPWLLKALIPVLDDETILGHHGGCITGPAGMVIPEGFNRPDRACDRAVNLAAAIRGQGFSFAIDPLANYTPQQRAEVRRMLENLPSLP